MLSSEEKLLRAAQAIFILQASRVKMGGHDKRKMLGVAMKDITAIKKSVDKTLKRYEKSSKERNS